MSDGQSSCRPARLLRFRDTVDAAADGLARRAGALDDALAAYRSGCSSDYRVPTTDTDGVVRSFGTSLRDWGEWVGAVGQAFLDAMAVGAYVGLGGSTDPEDVRTFSDDELLDYLSNHLDEGEDPFRGVPEGMAEQLALDLGVDYDQDEPPAWIAFLGAGGNVFEVAGRLTEGAAKVLAGLPQSVTVTLRVEGETLLLLSNGTVVSSFVSAEMQARIRLPAANTARLASAGRWIGRVSNVFSGAAGFASQWHQDAGLPTGDRVIRAATRGGLTVVGSVAGGAGAGVAAGSVCGPGAPVCSTVLGIGGALAGGILGDRAADLLPWMDSNEPLPGEHDLDEIRDGVAAEDASVDPALGATVDLVASDLALDATADDPYVHGRVVGLLPDRERLEFVIATGELPENVTPTGTTTTTTTTVPITVPVTVPAPGDAAATPPGTTTTTVPAPHAPAVTPDPWVEPRPYE